MLSNRRGFVLRWLAFWHWSIGLGASGLLAAPPEPLHHAHSNAFGIHYAQPEKYLKHGSQTFMTREQWDKVRGEVKLEPMNLGALKNLYTWKKNAFKSVRGGGKFVGKQTVQDLLLERILTGCHDHGLVLTAILRRTGVPAVFVDATGVEWAEHYTEQSKSFRGHVFVEAYLDKAWVLLDSVSGEYIPVYNPLCPLIPIKKPEDAKGFYVMFKGLDPADYGITNVQQLNQTQSRFGAMIRSESEKFLHPAYVVKSL